MPRMHTHPQNSPLRRVVVGMSGGVDSAVAAALLLEAGFEVHGVTLQLWQAPFVAEPPPQVQAIADALQLPLTVLDLRERFFREVVVPWMEEYARGRTPNPCVSCNPSLKFAALLETADRLGAPWIATGHYARVTIEADGSVALRQARALQRDQSYMLYRLSQAQLTRLQLPLGEVADKAKVRAHAARLGLPNAGQSDSQDLCFLKGGDYRMLLQQLLPERLTPGPIVDRSGREIGRHAGLPLYTVGQRSGLGLALGTPYYVLELRPQDHALVVGPAEALLRTACRLENLTFVRGAPPAPGFDAEARIRYRAARTPAHLEIEPDQRARVTFETPQRGLAPGQSVVFYSGDEVLGGGLISSER